MAVEVASLLAEEEAAAAVLPAVGEEAVGAEAVLPAAARAGASSARSPGWSAGPPAGLPERRSRPG